MIADKHAKIISLAGEISWRTVPSLRQRLVDMTNQGYRCLVLNLDGVDYIDSSGLALLITINRRIRGMQGELVLTNVAEPIMRALRQARLCEMIPSIGKGVTSHGELTAVQPKEEPVFKRTLSIPYDATWMAKARQAFGELLCQMNFPKDVAYDLVLALGEALGNALDHGVVQTQGTAGTVNATVTIYLDRVVIEVVDCGCGCQFDGQSSLPEPTETRGRGIRLMMMLTDSLTIRPRQSGSGTCVRMVKMIDVRSFLQGLDLDNGKVLD